MAAPGIGHYPVLAWVAFAPWFISLGGLSTRLAGLSGLAMGMAYIVPGRWDTFAAAVSAAGYHQGTQDAITGLFFLSYAFPFAAFGLLDGRLRAWTGAAPQRWALLRAAVLASLICGMWSPFPYTPVSIVVGASSWLQLAAVGGEPLLLFLLLWPSTLVAGLVQQKQSLREQVQVLAWLVFALSSVVTFGHWRIQSMDQLEAGGGGVRLSAIPLQLDLPQQTSVGMIVRDRAGSTISALELSREGLRRRPDGELLIWPELPIDRFASERVCTQAQVMADNLGRALVLQCFRPQGSQFLLTSELRLPQHDSTQFHAKSSLVPIYEQPLWGEGPILAGAPGTVFALDQARQLIPTLCYELHSRAHLRTAVLAGGNIVVHMASFAPFGRHPIDIWDQGMAQLRAVEFGVPIVRAANRAPVGWIDANGRSRSTSARFGSQAWAVDLWSPATAPTVYAYLSPVAAWLPALALLLLTGIGRRRVRRPD